MSSTHSIPCLHEIESSPQSINASIVQGSVLGPTLFNVNSCELSPLSAPNRYFKYADDAYLIIPASNSASISSELQHHAAWAASCNLKLNPSKTAEIIFTNKRVKEPQPNSNITRVTSMKILGVLVDSKLTFKDHINAVITSCSQSFFALRTLKQHGLSERCLQTVFKSTVISKLSYAASSFWGFLSSCERTRLESFLRRAVKFGYYPLNGPDLTTLQYQVDENLFNAIFDNPLHVLYYLLPQKKTTPYNLRPAAHGLVLPRKDDRNFINRMLYIDLY